MDSVLAGIAEQVRAAGDAGTVLCIRGGGSKDFYGGPPQGELLDTRPLNGITSYEPSELVVTVRAGTPLAELEAALAEQGQCLPFEPPHFGMQSATVGGMVAAGLSGPARASVGGVRDYVLGLQLLNGRAEHLTFGGQVMKNVAGYDVSRLMVGAMGTLGLITDVSLKVLPVAPAEATLVFELGQAEALAQLQRWGAQPLPLNASCWVRDLTAQVDAKGAGRDLLFVRLRGAIAAVESACQRMQQQVSGTLMDNAAAAPDWRACRDLRLPFFANPPAPDRVLWRLSVAQAAPVLDLPWPQLIEWHGGLRWLWAPLEAASIIRDTATLANGNAAIFIANNSISMRANAKFTAWEPLKPPVDAIHRRLKAEFDPAAIFNRNRLFLQD